MNQVTLSNPTLHTDSQGSRHSRPLNHVRNSRGEWFLVLVIFLSIWAFFMWYHAVRGRPYSLFVANKCVGIGAVFCVGLALSLGPTTRNWPGTRRALKYRRTLGVTGAVMAAPHVLGSLFLFPKEFPWDWYLENWSAIVLGAASFILLGVIAVHSNAWGFRRMGTRRWVGMQQLAWLSFGLLVGHLTLQGKFSGGIKWLNTFDKPFPPGAFTTTLFCLGVLGLKIWDAARNGKQPAV